MSEARRNNNYERNSESGEVVVVLSDVISELRHRGENMQQVANELFEAATLFHQRSLYRDDENVNQRRLAMIDAIMRGKNVASVFSEHTLSPSTSRLLEVWVSLEVASGLELLDFSEKLEEKNSRGDMLYVNELVKRFDKKQTEEFFAIYNRLHPATQKVFVCWIEGKTPSEVVAISKKPRRNIESSFKRIRDMIKEAGYTDTTFPIPLPNLRKRRESFTLLKDLEEYLPSIDEVCRNLSRRLSWNDLDRITYSLFESGFLARGTATMLETLTAPEGFLRSYDENRGISLSERPRLSRIYQEKFSNLLYVYRPRRLPRKPVSQLPGLGKSQSYEDTLEAQQMIFKVMLEDAHKHAPLLTAEQEVELAKRIEAGVWAQIRLGLLPESGQEARILEYISSYVQDFNPGLLKKFSKEELEQLISDGRGAFLHFMKANVALAYAAIPYAMRHQGLLTLDEGKRASLEGVGCALRRFDYKLGYKFSTYAYSWIQRRLKIRRHQAYEGVPAHIVADWEKLRYAETCLMQDLQTESITHEQLAQRTGMKLPHIRKVFELMTPHSAWSASRTAQMQSSSLPPVVPRFSHDMAVVLEKTFANAPITLQILKSHFEKEDSLEEIAGQLHITVHEARERLRHALAVLRDKLA